MTFTQQQLEEAYEQMKKERKADLKEAKKAAKWLKDKIGLDVGTSVGNRYYGTNDAVTPWPWDIYINVYYGTYNDCSDDFKTWPQVSKVSSHRGAFFLDLSNEPGFDQRHKYNCRFEYLDHGNW